VLKLISTTAFVSEISSGLDDREHPNKTKPATQATRLEAAIVTVFTGHPFLKFEFASLFVPLHARMRYEVIVHDTVDESEKLWHRRPSTLVGRAKGSQNSGHAVNVFDVTGMRDYGTVG